MSAIYIHIPFCRKACTYCDFHFVTNLGQIPVMRDAIKQEIMLRKGYFPDNDKNIRTIYFGGGTPSVLTPEEIQELINTIYNHFHVKKESIEEITLECNPEDLTKEYIRKLKEETDINRISIGIQSFVERDLLWMQRGHAHIEILDIIRNCRESGFNNITVDLILGIPGLSEEEWENNLKKAISLNVEHLSVYALTMEPKTALAHQVKKQIVRMPDEEVFDKQFFLAHQLLCDAGYEHYELSNYAKPGFRSIHNRSYWKGVFYLGVGPSAHSFNGMERSWNVSNNARYTEALKQMKTAVEETEILSLENRYNEYIMTHLRIAEGLDTEYIKQSFGINIFSTCGEKIDEMITRNYLIREGTRLKPTLSGWMVSDYLASELFLG